MPHHAPSSIIEAHFRQSRRGGRFISSIANIIIADDEQIQREGLAGIVASLCPEADIRPFANGQEVLEALERGPCDLLLTDIAMPVMDGIELIRRMAESWPRVKIILISAYQEFEYAKAAIQYQVKDYLIKPFRISEVKSLLEAVARELALEQQNEADLRSFANLTEEARVREANQGLYSLLTGTAGPGLSGEVRASLDTFGTVCALLWSSSSLSPGDQEAPCLNRLVFLFSSPVMVWPPGPGNGCPGRLALFLPGCSAADAAQKLESIRLDLAQSGITLWSGVSNSRTSLLHQAADAYTQATEALSYRFYVPEGGVFTYEGENNALEQPMLPLAPWESAIRQALRDLSEEELNKALESLCQELAAGARIYPNRLRHHISSMVVTALRDLEGGIQSEQFTELLDTVYESYVQCEFFGDLFRISRQVLSAGLGYYRESLTEGDPVAACIRYIQDHLEEELSLQKVAGIMHFHPNYLSAQIKNRLGVSYSAYVLGLRMERACTLLTGTDDKVRDVAHRCGFPDDNYFIRVFRREYKLSPEQYRKVYRHD